MQAYSPPFRSLAFLATTVALHASCTILVDAQLEEKPPSSTSSSSNSSGMGGTGNDGGTGGVGGGGSSVGGGGSAPCDGMCKGSETCCPDGCFVLQTDDVKHCGACDKVCATGDKCCGGTCAACCNDADCPTADHQCIEGACVLECTPPAVQCGDACALLATDTKHCGMCDNDCLSGHPCVGGKCQSGWATMTETGALSPRQRAAATWTGSKLFIWGGLNPQGALDDGALYDPKTDTWEKLPDTGSPGPRVDAVAVAMGDQVLVCSGGPDSGTGALNTGRIFDLASSTWKDVKNVSFGSRNPIALWTGTKVLLLGGMSNGGPISNGALYDPLTDTWTTTSISNAPGARTGPGWTWSGTELLIFGGRKSGFNVTAEGYAFNPETNSWRSLSPINAPAARYDTFAAWTGVSLLVFGGRDVMMTYADAALYDPIANMWTSAAASPLGTRSAPTARTGWASSGTAKILIAGGVDETQALKVDGRVYDSMVNDWGAQSLTWPSGADHEYGVGVWTGAEFILWSGLDNSVLTAVGERYRP